MAAYTEIPKHTQSRMVPREIMLQRNRPMADYVKLHLGAAVNNYNGMTIMSAYKLN